MAEVFESPLIVRNERVRQRAHSINDPELDIANESGNMAFDIPTTYEEADDQIREINRRKRWQLNYQEAAIFLQEGENNDKYYTHPRSYDALPAYEVAHNTWFYVLDFSAALLVLLMALCERPAVPYLSLPVGVHGSLELLGLLILSLDLGIRLKWLGWRTCLKHKRTVIKAGTLFIMVVESIVVLVRQANHFRVTRALRPLFLIHSHYCRGVRRISRQVLQSLPPILDMIFLLLFFMLIFSILGFYLLSQIDNNDYFKTIQDSFVSLFVLLTTANFPDVMMPAYATSPFYSLFFIVYLSLELYFLMNLLLAVVYDTFLNLEKDKLRSLFFHKREGCQHAFKLVTTKENCATLSVRHFVGMMKYFRPKRETRDYYLMFKTLNTSKTGGITLEEFYKMYEVSALQWKLKNDESLWSSNFRHPCNIGFKGVNAYEVPQGRLILNRLKTPTVLSRFVNWKWFDYFIYLVIACNFLWILIETIDLSRENAYKSPKEDVDRFETSTIHSVNVKSYDFTASWTSIVFVCIYSVEAILKILGKGPHVYFTSGWDLFDFLVTVISVIGVLLEILDDSFYYIIVLRPFRLLRLFKIKRRYRDVLGTLFVLFTRLASLAVVIIMLYYFFAIIGMEVFLNVDLRNCCRNSSMADYYKFDNKTYVSGYYLNNFNNILTSGVTLFELTVVNNWFIIMEGYALGMNEWTRIYFMLFYIVMMVVMNIVVAFVLESFLFRIQYRRTMDVEDIEDHGVYKVEVGLSEEEKEMCERPHAWLTGSHIANQESQDTCQLAFVYRGERIRGKEDFSLRMYGDEVQGWVQEVNEKRREAISELEEMRQNRYQRPRYATDLTDNNDLGLDTDA